MSTPAPAPAPADRRALWRTARIVPPEGVPLTFRVAGLGARVFAQAVDLLLSALLLGLVLVALALTVGPGAYLQVVASLGYFFLRLPYYALAEIAWNGATLGKRLTGLRVIDAAGGPLSLHAIAVRNLMREAEVFLPLGLLFGLGGAEGTARLVALGWIGVCLTVPLVNRRRQRLGDVLAGTMVILRPQALLLPDAAALSGADAYTFRTDELEHYGAFELQTLESLLRALDTPRRRRKGPSRAQARQLAEVAEAICTRIGRPPVPPGDHARFLSAFYRAQRRHLEDRQVMGERRADKHHAARGRTD